MASFSEILDEPASLPEPPRAMPVGHYICTVRGRPNHEKHPKTGTPMSIYTLQYMKAEPDVNQDDLRDALVKRDGSMGRLQDKSIRLQFYLTDAAKWRLDKFLSVDLGIDIKGMSKGMQEEEANGKQVRIYVKHTPSESGDTIYANVDRTYKVQDDI